MNKKDRIFIEIIVGLSLITAALYFFVGTPNKSIWPADRVDADSGSRLVMGTFAHIIAVAIDSGTAEDCVETAFAQIQKVDELMSDYNSDSQICQVNRDGSKRAVKVSESTYEVLQKAVRFSKLSSGVFDVTVGPLVDLWRSAGEANSLPSDEDIARAHSKVGYEKLILDPNDISVRFAVEGMRIDLGGIAKGYAVDKAVEAMKKIGAIGGMIEIGGDVRCFGAPPRGRNNWLIGLQDAGATKLNPETGKLLLVLELADAAVATSGDYRRFTVIGGKTYSHIIDAKTGRSKDELTSVTIISRSATDADALATAVSVMGAEKGLALIETIPETEAILVSSGLEYQITKTSGAEKYIR